jgi:hypothetical protein
MNKGGINITRKVKRKLSPKIKMKRQALSNGGSVKKSIYKKGMC